MTGQVALFKLVILFSGMWAIGTLYSWKHAIVYLAVLEFLGTREPKK